MIDELRDDRRVCANQYRRRIDNNDLIGSASLGNQQLHAV
jgi:hypothetical protein